MVTCQAQFKIDLNMIFYSTRISDNFSFDEKPIAGGPKTFSILPDAQLSILLHIFAFTSLMKIGFLESMKV